MERYPRVVIDLDKIEGNTRLLADKCSSSNIDIMGVSKIFCAEPKTVGAMVRGGIKYVADSRIENLKKLKEYNIPKVLLRLPMRSELNDLIDYVDISLNSEIETIKAIDNIANKRGKFHKIILMIELGDLREGILPEDIKKILDEVILLKNIDLVGVGVNLTCYGGVIPDEGNLGELLKIVDFIKKEYSITLEIISGGNSSSLYLIDEGRMPKEINNLRLGEAIALGRETAYGETITGASTDACVLQAEVIEVKKKPSVPKGKIGMDAFGNKPQFEDKGLRTRAILAVGRQDIEPDGLIPRDNGISIIGASSDHLILDIEDSSSNYQVGDILSFDLEYSALLKVMTSNYVWKHWKHGRQKE